MTNRGDNMNKVCFLGSINMDVVIKVDSMPKEGQTILADDIKKNNGGKGANQAVAARRSGAETYMIGKVGKDENGNILTKELLNDKIDMTYVVQDNDKPTGTAIITVNKNGNNSIIVISGANMTISQNQILEAESIIKRCDILGTQLETPIEAAKAAFKLAKKHGKLTVLNPSPSKTLDEELIKNTDILVPNETEIFDLTGLEVSDIDSAKMAAEKFIKNGMKAVIVTLGEKGAAIITSNNAELIPAYKVKAVDTTAAGDSFLGALVSKIDTKNMTFENLKEAVKFGNQVASIVVQRKGAQPSIPSISEVNEIYK